MAQIIGAPQQQMMYGSGMDIFGGASKIFIKQEMAAIEFCGCEAKQRYRISVPTADGKEGQVFLYISEESNCVERICCSVNRTLELKVHQGASKEGNVVQRMAKPFSLQGCCFCRPSFDVSGANPGEKIGRITDPCRCCWMDQQVMGPQDNVIFTTSGSPWQLGMCCPCCAGISFKVLKQGEQVGEVMKLPMDCQELFLKTNRFVIDFGSVKDANEKRMLLASGMLLDLAYFEQQK